MFASFWETIWRNLRVCAATHAASFRKASARLHGMAETVYSQICASGGRSCSRQSTHSLRKERSYPRAPQRQHTASAADLRAHAWCSQAWYSHMLGGALLMRKVLLFFSRWRCREMTWSGSSGPPLITSSTEPLSQPVRTKFLTWSLRPSFCTCAAVDVEECEVTEVRERMSGNSSVVCAGPWCAQAWRARRWHDGSAMGF